MKKLAVFLFVFLLANNIFGQEAKKNAVIMGMNFSGAYISNFSIGYERYLTDNFTVFFDLGTNIYFWPYGEIQGRWYPWAKTFFAGLGLGIFGFNTPNFYSPPSLPSAPMTSLSIGWKFDIGKSNNWVLIPGFTARIILDVRDINSVHIEFGVPEISLKIGRKF